MKFTGFNHLSLDIDDFQAACDTAKAMGTLGSTVFRNLVNELPDGCVQMFLRGPAGNPIEIDWPDIETLDRSRIPEMKLFTEVAEQNEGGMAAPLYPDRPRLKTARWAR